MIKLTACYFQPRNPRLSFATERSRDEARGWGGVKGSNWHSILVVGRSGRCLSGRLRLWESVRWSSGTINSDETDKWSHIWFLLSAKSAEKSFRRRHMKRRGEEGL